MPAGMKYPRIAGASFYPWRIAGADASTVFGSRIRICRAAIRADFARCHLDSQYTPIDDSNMFNPFNPALSSPQKQGDTSNQSTQGYRPSQFATNFPPPFNQQFQSQFPRNFSPYGMPSNYHPYGGFHPGIPYEANFSFPPSGVFGRGGAIEGARSSLPVESMVYGHGVVRSGAYTSSSNQESEDTEPRERSRPEGQKKAKAKLKGKEKKLTPEMSLESLKAEGMKVYHEATMRRAEAMEKAAKASKEKAKFDLLNKYLNMMDVDTTGHNDERKQRHESVLNYIQMQISPAGK
ncbi:hypothetical protein BAE44_0005311 [Dichanthelium oligosanthes]|uniref:No apical meristem-associated C-terminal domain-containing protein n=1 Tax=Dichanthelium oligosanthes TaxID=888268 RepID=A0A1E5W8T1_9POAL|nr:hypothetical protein BAE44_0005311 [Dichanthelium oligosanthes]